jgi:hypothetical protein
MLLNDIQMHRACRVVADKERGMTIINPYRLCFYLLEHGMSANPWQMDEIRSWLSENGYRMVGESIPPKASARSL